jgi:hypothetical protein
MRLEAQGGYSYGFAVSGPAFSGLKSSGYFAGADLLVPVYTSDGFQLRLGADYQFSYNDVTASASTPLDSRLWVNRLGLEVEAAWGGPPPPPPIGRLRVLTKGVDGKPLAGASLRLASPGSSEVTGTTGADGTALLEGLHEGHWTVDVTAPEYEPAQGAADVVAQKETAASVELKPVPPTTGTVHIHVVDLDGKPLPTAELTVGNKPQKLGDDASVTLEKVEPGPLPASATAEGFRPAKEVISVVAGQAAELTLKMVPVAKTQPATLSGHVRNSQGEPVAANIAIGGTDIRLRARSDGTFLVHVPPGVYRVTISAPGYLSQMKAVKLNPADEVIYNVDLFPTKP